MVVNVRVSQNPAKLRLKDAKGEKIVSSKTKGPSKNRAPCQDRCQKYPYLLARTRASLLCDEQFPKATKILL